MVVTYNHACKFANVYEIAPTYQLALEFEKSQFFLQQNFFTMELWSSTTIRKIVFYDLIYN
jgi:hypothetical protein